MNWLSQSIDLLVWLLYGLVQCPFNFILVQLSKLNQIKVQSMVDGLIDQPCSAGLIGGGF